MYYLCRDSRYPKSSQTHFVAIVLDKQNFLVGEYSMVRRNARKQIFAPTGKLLHVLGQIHERTSMSAKRSVL